MLSLSKGEKAEKNTWRERDAVIQSGCGKARVGCASPEPAIPVETPGCNVS